MSTFYSVPAVCDSIAGIRASIYSDMTNVENYGPGFLPPAPDTAPTFYDNDLLYSIAFERYSGELVRESQSDQGGDYAIHQLTFFVPKTRSEVDILLRRMRNRLMMAIGIDRYGNQHILFDARVSWRLTTGSKPGSRHGYFITFSATTHYLLPAIAGNGDIETAPPVGSSGDSTSSDCCITINPINIAYTPAPTGNAFNNNQMVTTVNGSVFFIDGDGRGLIINRPAPRYYVYDADGETFTDLVLPLDFPMPDPNDYPFPTYSEPAEISIRFWVKYGSRWLMYGHTEGFTLDFATHSVQFGAGVDGGTLEFYSYEGIDPRPL